MVTQVVFETLSQVSKGLPGTAPQIFSATTDQTENVVIAGGAASDLMITKQLKPKDVVFINGNAFQGCYTLNATSGGTLTAYLTVQPGDLLSENNLDDVDHTLISRDNIDLGINDSPSFLGITAQTITSTGYFISSVANGLTAHAGGGQASALQLAKAINRITTITTAGDSVKLPSAEDGMQVVVINAAGSNAMNIFPVTGESINNLAVNAALSLSANQTIIFSCAVDGIWNGVLTSVPVTVSSFVSSWNTANGGGVSTNTQIKLPLVATGTYNFNVNWGDGNSNTITTWNDAATTHTYSTSGIYTVTITGTITGWRFNGGDGPKILSISSWGPLRLGNSAGRFFYGCSHLDLSGVSDVLNLTGTTDLSSMFQACSPGLTTIANGNSWDVSNITNMQNLFAGCSNFDSDISNWDVSAVTNMEGMFESAITFNQPIGSWTTKTSAVTNMKNLFYNAASFNQSLDGWDVSSVTTMESLFDSATAFNQDLNSWDVSAVTSMRGTFANSSGFNPSTFNGNITSWVPSAVTDMGGIFTAAVAFNQNISGWDTSSVTDMSFAFYQATAFNQPIGGWDTGLVADMTGMFYQATSFDQDIGSWNITNVYTAYLMFEDVTLSKANYNALLAGWAAQAITYLSVPFSGGNSHYDSSTGGHDGTAGRAILTDTYGWTVIDGGTP